MTQISPTLNLNTTYFQLGTFKIYVTLIAYLLFTILWDACFSDFLPFTGLVKLGLFCIM